MPEQLKHEHELNHVTVYENFVIAYYTERFFVDGQVMSESQTSKNFRFAGGAAGKHGNSLKLEGMFTEGTVISFTAGGEDISVTLDAAYEMSSVSSQIQLPADMAMTQTTNVDDPDRPFTEIEFTKDGNPAPVTAVSFQYKAVALPDEVRAMLEAALGVAQN